MSSHSSQSVYIFKLLIFYLFKPKSVVFLTVSYTNTLLILCVYFILFYVSLTKLLNFFSEHMLIKLNSGKSQVSPIQCNIIFFSDIFLLQAMQKKLYNFNFDPFPPPLPSICSIKCKKKHLVLHFTSFFFISYKLCSSCIS